MVVAAVLAGGSGTRMGAALPKQYLEIGSVPIIIRSIYAFISRPQVDACIVSVAAPYVGFTKNLIAEFIKSDKKIYVIEGGVTRGGTLLAVLEFMRESSMLDSLVLTHDAVRPFVNERIIDENIAAAKKYGACNTCIPCVDSVISSSDGIFADAALNRSEIFRVQTPQSFNAKQLYKLIKSTPESDFSSMTDGCAVYAYHGKKVYMVKGEEYNIKITFPEDIKRAENIAADLFQYKQP